jgi:hypothetical protein
MKKSSAADDTLFESLLLEEYGLSHDVIHASKQSTSGMSATIDTQMNNMLVIDKLISSKNDEIETIKLQLSKEETLLAELIERKNKLLIEQAATKSATTANDTSVTEVVSSVQEVLQLCKLLEGTITTEYDLQFQSVSKKGTLSYTFPS